MKDIVTVAFPESQTKWKGTWQWQHDGVMHEMEPGDVRPMQQYLYEHAHRLPGCPLVLVNASMGPAELAIAERKTAEKKVKELELAASKAVDDLAAAKRERDARVGIEKARVPQPPPPPKKD